PVTTCHLLSHLLLLSCSALPRDLLPFPTRRSSDLTRQPPWFSTKPHLMLGDACARVLLTRALVTPARRPAGGAAAPPCRRRSCSDRKSTRLNSSHEWISYAVFCLKKKTNRRHMIP